MKKLGIVMAGLLSVMTAYAQDAVPESAPADAASTESAAPADNSAAVPADSTPVEAAPAEAAPVETVPVESTSSYEAPPAEAPAVEERKPWLFYGGYDRAHINFLISTPDPSATTPTALKTRFGGDSFSADFNRFRFGTRLLKFIGLEGQFGVKGGNGSDPGSVSVNKYYGFFVVPTGTLLDTVEIGAVLGYSKMDLENGSAKESFKGFSYGVNSELPLRKFFESWPDLRVGLGGMVYHQKDEARIYGYHVGLRYDFKI